MGFAGAMTVAMIVDALLGWPESLFARVGHPVTWLGRLITILDVSCNRPADTPAVRRIAGAMVALGVIALAGGSGLGCPGRTYLGMEPHRAFGDRGVALCRATLTL